MDRNRWIIFGVLCAAVVGSLIFFNKKSAVDVGDTDPYKITTTGEIKDHVYGNTSSGIILIEYADYQCPGCYSAYANTKKITEQYKEHVSFVFRNFPLTSIHQHAFANAAAAESASLQGKYWEMHDMIFTHRQEWVDASAEERTKKLESYATTLGMNLEKFRQDMTSEVVTNKINSDRALGLKSDVTSTPTLFLNGTKLDEAVVTDLMQESGQKLKDKLDALIKEKGGTPPATTSTQ